MMVSSLLYYQVKYGLDPSTSLDLLQSFLILEAHGEESGRLVVVTNWDPHMVVLTQCLQLAPLGVQQAWSSHYFNMEVQAHDIVHKYHFERHKTVKDPL